MPQRLPHLVVVLLMFAAASCSAAEPASRYAWPFPTAASKKGLQVQMVDDALALGVKHAALNFNFGQFLAPSGGTDQPGWDFEEYTYRFQRGYLEAMDRQIKTLSDRGVVVSLILLAYEPQDPDLRRILLHPGYSTNCPNHLSAFNTVTPEGRAWFAAGMEFLAERWSRPDQKFGRVVNWIVGNEVNSHWFWANMGRVTMEQFADDHLRTVRLAQTSIRKQSAHSRVYLSLEHHWNIRYPGGDERQAFAARPFLEYFDRRAKEGGDFDWHIAFHPYPENLGNPRAWLDKSATPDFATTPRITFKNLGQLIAFLRQPGFLHDGRQRRVILSEQGFHTPATSDGEAVQAAAYCYAWKQAERLDGIDSFILHRHVDHAQEGGLMLGLWTHKPGSIADPDRKKPSYEVFRLADTPEWEKAFAFALPVIGIKSWEELGR